MVRLCKAMSDAYGRFKNSEKRLYVKKNSVISSQASHYRFMTQIFSVYVSKQANPEVISYWLSIPKIKASIYSSRSKGGSPGL